MDIYVKDGKETLYNIEMQTTENRNLLKRTKIFLRNDSPKYLGKRG